MNKITSSPAFIIIVSAIVSVTISVVGSQRTQNISETVNGHLSTSSNAKTSPQVSLGNVEQLLSAKLITSVDANGVSSQETSSFANLDENRRKALAYAKKYWNTVCHCGYSYNKYGGDCAHFVSHCLASGGYNNLGAGRAWQGNEEVFISVPRLYNWLVPEHGTVVDSIEELVPGDIIFYENLQHVVIYIGNGKVAGHSGRCWGKDYHYRKPYTLIHVKYPAKTANNTSKQQKGKFITPSSYSDPYLSEDLISRLNWAWPTIVEVCKEEDIPPYSLAFLHYVETATHFSLKNPRNGEGVFQLHDITVMAKNNNVNLFPYTGEQLTKKEFTTQASMAAKALQKKAEEGSGQRLVFELDPLDSEVINAVYGYNGKVYGKYNPPSNTLKKTLQKLNLPSAENFARSPYIVGRLTESEQVMYLSTVGTCKIEFYGYIPFVLQIQQLQ